MINKSLLTNEWCILRIYNMSYNLLRINHFTTFKSIISKSTNEEMKFKDCVSQSS